jgi:hypothetical protein
VNRTEMRYQVKVSSGRSGGGGDDKEESRCCPIG